MGSYSGYGFAFPAHSASAGTAIRDLQNTLCIVIVFHAALLLITALTSRQQEHGSVPVLTEFTGPTTFLTSLTDTEGSVYSARSLAVPCRVGEDSLEGCVCSELVSNIFMGPGIKGKKWDGVPLIITPSYPLAKLLLVVCTTLCSPGLGVIVPKGGMLTRRNTTMIPLP